MDTLHPRARRIVERVEEELGQTCSENLCGRSSCLPEVHGAYGDKNLSTLCRSRSLYYIQ
jgi:hypothetical protein